MKEEPTCQTCKHWNHRGQCGLLLKLNTTIFGPLININMNASANLKRCKFSTVILHGQSRYERREETPSEKS